VIFKSRKTTHVLANESQNHVYHKNKIKHSKDNWENVLTMIFMIAMINVIFKSSITKHVSANES
jgi:hypothetical protein